MPATHLMPAPRPPQRAPPPSPSRRFTLTLPTPIAPATFPPNNNRNQPSGSPTTTPSPFSRGSARCTHLHCLRLACIDCRVQRRSLLHARAHRRD
eukprot:6060343-Pleurochrysis_carterae.AAC.1